jgi:hypothetical protein
VIAGEWIVKNEKIAGKIAKMGKAEGKNPKSEIRNPKQVG